MSEACTVTAALKAITDSSPNPRGDDQEVLECESVCVRCPLRLVPGERGRDGWRFPLWVSLLNVLFQHLPGAEAQEQSQSENDQRHIVDVAE